MRETVRLKRSERDTEMERERKTEKDVQRH